MFSHSVPRNFKPSAKNAPDFKAAGARTHAAKAFVSGATIYDAVRPSYPPRLADLVASAASIVDIGAGTGKLTHLLQIPGRELFAIDPSADMLRTLRANLPQVHLWQATAEATGLQSASVDAAVCAQTWHWVDSDAASREAHRVVKPNGRLLLCWNTLDVTHPWVLRYSRISHSGDVHRQGFYPFVATPWQLVDEVRTTWVQPVTPADLIALAKTRSYWLHASETTRRKVEANLHWYLYERLGFAADQLLPLPYRTDAFVYARGTTPSTR